MLILLSLILAGSPARTTGDWHAEVLAPAAKSPSAIVVSRMVNGADVPIWRTELAGDYHYHTISLVDINGDDVPDVLAYAGEEDVFITHVFLNRNKSAKADDAFVRAYAGDTSYDVLYDFDHDGKGELLVSTQSADGLDCELDAKSMAASAEYAKTVTGPYGATRFDYGAPQYDGETYLIMREPVKVMAVRGEKLVDASKSYPAFFAWRAKVLRATARAADHKACAAYFTQLARQAEKYAR